MNCHEAQRHLCADREGALDSPQRVTLEQHVGQCPDCRRTRDDLTAALSTWRSKNAVTPVPDAQHEWHAVRRRIRGAAEAGTAAAARPRRNIFPWLAVPLGAAAALAVAFYVAPLKRGSPHSPAELASPGPQIARADFVEVPGGSSTIVFVDNKSGWLFVQASDSRG